MLKAEREMFEMWKLNYPQVVNNFVEKQSGKTMGIEENNCYKGIFAMFTACVKPMGNSSDAVKFPLYLFGKPV